LRKGKKVWCLGRLEEKKKERETNGVLPLAGRDEEEKAGPAMNEKRGERELSCLGAERKKGPRKGLAGHGVESQRKGEGNG